MSYITDWKESDPKSTVSKDLIRKFLACVHSFTYVGLEAQTTAYSCGRNGVIKVSGNSSSEKHPS